MSRSIVVSLVVLALLQAAVAVAVDTTTIDVSNMKNIEIRFTEEDAIPKTALKSLIPKTYADSFIGDIEIGSRQTDESIVQRVIIFDNPKHSVQQTDSLNFKVDGTIHYLYVYNYEGSFAVVCATKIGSSSISVTIRANPETHSKLFLLLAWH